MRPFTTALGLTLALAVTACGEAAAPDAEGFSASLSGDTLRLHNGTSAPVHYAVSDVEDPNTLLWLYCAGPGCPSITPEEELSMLIPDAWFAPYAPLYLHWWHAVPDGAGSHRADRLHTIELRP